MQKSAIHITIDSDVYGKFRRACAFNGHKMTRLICNYIESYIAENAAKIGIEHTARPDLGVTSVEMFNKILAMRCSGHLGATVGELLREIYLSPGSLNYDRYRKLLEPYGLKITKSSDLAIAKKHMKIVHKLERVAYSKTLQKHDFCITSDYVVRIGGKSTRCMIFKGENLERYLRDNP